MMFPEDQVDEFEFGWEREGQIKGKTVHISQHWLIQTGLKGMKNLVSAAFLDGGS